MRADQKKCLRKCKGYLLFCGVLGKTFVVHMAREMITMIYKASMVYQRWQGQEKYMNRSRCIFQLKKLKI